jgi:isopentenyl diphosphate isomerase/L-lactate dehydrogenase-like FMN-dependent dehydrogenase
MSREAFAYVVGGAGGEAALRGNREAFRRWQIVPRVLRDVSARELTVQLFSRTLPAPLLLAPVGVLEMAHPESDFAVARAAAAEGIPFVFSTQASRPMEECARAMADVPRWFQLYWRASDALVESFVARAEACGCEAIVVTLDTHSLGWRPRDLDLAYLPFAHGKGLAQYTSDPVFNELVTAALASPQPEERGRITPAAVRTLVDIARAHPGRLLENLRSPRPRAAIRTFLGVHSRPSLVWEDFPFLRERTRLPILLKGILHPDDARRAVEVGADGVVVSNHGGRQLDGAVGALDALPGVVEAVGRCVPVLFDSGIRGGADAFKALALGAKAVLIGRPYVYGLALAGEAGVREVIRNLVAELDLTMALAGCASVAEIGPESLRRAP